MNPQVKNRSAWFSPVSIRVHASLKMIFDLLSSPSRHQVQSRFNVDDSFFQEQLQVKFCDSVVCVMVDGED